jgi:hypothetical protein
MRKLEPETTWTDKPQKPPKAQLDDAESVSGF